MSGGSASEEASGSRSGGRARGASRLAAAAPTVQATDGALPIWEPWNPEQIGAETIFLCRKGDQISRVLLNQFGQVLIADTRWLLEWLPEEMALLP